MSPDYVYFYVARIMLRANQSPHQGCSSRHSSAQQENGASECIQVIRDGDEVFVEYSAGAVAFQARWEGRPTTPPFQWGDEGIVLPAHDVWLTGARSSHVATTL